MLGLPEPTPTLVLMGAMIQADAPEHPDDCADRMRGIVRRIAPHGTGNVVLKRPPAILEASRDAIAVLSRVCVVCTRREACKGRLE